MCDMAQIQQLQNLLQQYEESKKAFEEAKKHKGAANLTSQNIMSSITVLFTLKHNGKKIKELYDAQNTSRHKEFKNTEYVHKGTINKIVEPSKPNKSNKKKKHNDKDQDKKESKSKSKGKYKDMDVDETKKNQKGMYYK